MADKKPVIASEIVRTLQGQVNSTKTAIEKRLQAVLQMDELRTDETAWLRKTLEESPQLTLLQIAKQARFLLDRVQSPERQDVLRVLNSGYCLNCGDYVGDNPCPKPECKPITGEQNVTSG